MAHWSDWAACRDHPTLGPDAWFDIARGHPQVLGVEAIAVCQTECPVMMECREAALDSGERDQVVGGGWLDPKGRFRQITSMDNARQWQARQARRRAAA